MRYEVTFHDAHGAKEPCSILVSCSAKSEIVDAQDAKSAAIRAFLNIDNVRNDAQFLSFASDPNNWTQDGDNAWFLDDSGGDASLYPLTVTRFPCTADKPCEYCRTVDPSKVFETGKDLCDCDGSECNCEFCDDNACGCDCLCKRPT